MNKIILSLSLLLLASPALADSNCFLAKENNKILKQDGDCSTRYAPGSTFKVPLSLMGFDSGILEDAAQPVWPIKEGYNLYINVCKGAHNPREWMRDSCVWYSRVLTGKLGLEKFKDYIVKFDYGNKDISGDKGKNNGLTHAWISSSLEISPEEQIVFLQKLIDSKLPVSGKAREMTKKIMFMQELPAGWKLNGKSGNGQQLNSDRTEKTELQHGWFVGWIEKGDRKITFASHITDSEKQNVFASFRARNEAVNKLWYLINDLEK
jgi:beta-lactamase class D